MDPVFTPNRPTKPQAPKAPLQRRYHKFKKPSADAANKIFFHPRKLDLDLNLDPKRNIADHSCSPFKFLTT
jgi:hypothetical protein